MNKIFDAEEPCNFYTLANGLRIIHTPRRSPVAYAGLAIDAGTRDENEDELGMAHFVEHLIFKGTKKRKAWHILNRMESVGGDLNAYTNKEETVVYSVFLSMHLDRAVELLADLTLNAIFPAHEIEKETEVIIDEIQSYEDTPAELIFDDFEELLYPNHPLGRQILGTPASLRTFGTPEGLSWTKRFYQPSNMVLFVQGDFEFRKIVRIAEKYLGERPLQEVVHHRFAPPALKPCEVIKSKDTHQAHVMIGARAYESGDKKRTALYLLNNILGGPGMNSKLNVSLREHSGLVYEVESNLSSFTDTGVFSIYFGCDIDDVERCIELSCRELKKLCQQKMSSAALQAAQKQLIGQIGVSYDNCENNVLAMAKTYLHYHKYEGANMVCQRILDLTPQQLLEVANEIFAEDRLSTLIYK